MNMDPTAPMILPKGIVINTKTIYKEVASYSVIPTDKICQYWHVYTTTNKRLKDPTARRLENFWWQVWGSDRRNLSGRALARLFEDISVGPTIVPLHGPPNRWEGPNVPPLTKQLVVAHLNREFDAIPQRPEPSRMRSNELSVRSLSSSASKPPPSHPILKNARGRIAVGPKPTARFASPPELKDDETKQGNVSSSSSAAVTGLDVAVRPMQTASEAQKLIVDSTLATSRSELHPAERASPRSAVATAGVAIQEAKSPETRPAPNLDPSSTAPPLTEQLANDEATKSERPRDDDLTGLPNQPAFSAKAAGKKSATARNAITNRQRASKTSAPPTLSTSTTHSLARNTSDLRSPVSVRSLSLTRTDTDNSSLAGSVSDSSSTMAVSLSQNGFARKTSTQGLFTGATATTTNVAAQGQIIDQAGSLPASSVLNLPVQDGNLTSRRSASSLLDSRMVPTQPSQAANVPMGRTRSQLTLLLEREKARGAEKSRFRS